MNNTKAYNSLLIFGTAIHNASVRSLIDVLRSQYLIPAEYIYYRKH
jgi:hypothetical protein